MLLALTGGTCLNARATHRIPWTQSSKSQFTSSIDLTGGWFGRELTYSSIIFQRNEAFPEGAIPHYYPVRSQHRVIVTMGSKGDGKKQRKKKSTIETTMSSAATTPQQAPPLRVSNRINIPVRDQIRIAQLNKESSSHEGSSFRQKKIDRTSYRRKWGRFISAKTVCVKFRMAFCSQ
jgi:hypothetical protein